MGRELRLIRLMLQDFHQVHFPESIIYKNTKNYKSKEDYRKTYDDESTTIDVDFEREFNQQEKDRLERLGL